ncbi:mechanosensitive ion channel family protein [Desulfocurvibacter africanus]|uniref:mechanosensitive ion channel family protein n=1 Tax=Desulfocurvibacter africanus TaxID=873 RepID=UPI000419B4F8|nr:mechanosensitive ion channel family protein [Desulfocurvibacter africanus]
MRRWRLAVLLAAAFITAMPASVITAQDVPPVLGELDDGGEQPAAIPLQAVPDELLESRLNAVFANIPDYRDIRAEARGGVVRLTGRTDNLAGAKEAERLASRLEGVAFVVDEMHIEPQVDIRFEPMLRKLESAIEGLLRLLPVLALALAVVGAFWLLGRAIARWDWLFSRLSGKRLRQYFLRAFVSRLMLLVGIVLGLYVLDLAALVGAIIGAAGLIGLALGFAFRDIAENYLAGFLLSSRSLFSVGDRVDICAHEGKLVRMGMRELILMTYEGNHVRIPNAEVFRSVTVNYSRNPQRECNFSVGVDTGEDLDHVRAVGCGALAGMTGVLHDPEPFMRVEEFGEYAMLVRFHVWVDQRTYSFRKVRSEAKRILKLALDEAGIRMPSPQQEITLRRAGERARDAGAGQKARNPVAEAARQVDVSPEEHIRRQIDEEITRSL